MLLEFLCLSNSMPSLAIFAPLQDESFRSRVPADGFVQAGERVSTQVLAALWKCSASQQRRHQAFAFRDHAGQSTHGGGCTETVMNGEGHPAEAY
ncbi:MAG TPA: hypothetical protein DEF45_02995 [Rhodopirellula sp.]|nr:hypothetical protein [Rhodopirellula sp.]